MKRGTILKNLWAGYETYFIYMGWPVRTRKGEAAATRGYTITNVDGEWRFRTSEYYTHSLQDREHYPIVGWIDLDKLIADGVLQAIETYQGKEVQEETPDIVEAEGE